MDEELMDIVMNYFVKKNIRGEDRLKELMYLHGGLEAEMYGKPDDPAFYVRPMKRRHYASE
jgi:hypothetical protein